MICGRYCFPCVVHDWSMTIDLTFPVWEDRMRVLEAGLELLSVAKGRDQLPSALITDGYLLINEACAPDLPFAEQRRRANEAGRLLAEKVVRPVAAQISDPLDRLSYLIRWSVAGNAADFRSVAMTASQLSAQEMTGMFCATFEAQFRNGLEIDQVRQIHEEIGRARQIVIVHDNVGEIALDAELCRELVSRGKSVTSVVHGPISSDADLSDAREMGLEDVCTKVMQTRQPTLGLILDRLTEDELAAIAEADLILAKGQANYYQLTELLATAAERSQQYAERLARPALVALLRTKCVYAYEPLGLKSNGNAAVVLRRSSHEGAER